MIARRIILEAVGAAGGACAGWRVGTTDDPRRSRREHQRPPTWSCWYAGNAEMARAVEGRLLAIGMAPAEALPGRGAGGGRIRGDPCHVYTFRA